MKNYGLLFITVLGLLVTGLVVYTYYPRVCEHCYAFERKEADLGIIYPDDGVLPVERVYDNGFHKIFGELTLPNPCYEIVGLVILNKPVPQSAVIDLRTIQTSDVCSQVLTEKRFQVEFQSTEIVVLHTYINGKPVQIEYKEGEEPLYE